MTNYIKFTLYILLFLLAACSQGPQPAGNNAMLSSLMKKATDNMLPAKERLEAALTGDSLAVRLQAHKEHLEYTRLAGLLYWKMGQTDTACSLFQLTAKLADSLGEQTTLGMAYNNIGLILSERSAYDSALFYYSKAERIFRAEGNRFRLAQGLINTGIVYKNIGNLDTAFSKTLDAVHILELLDSLKEQATAYSTLGNVLRELGRPEESLAYHHKAIAVRSRLKDTTGIAGAMNNIGNVYRGKKEYDEALKYYLQGLALMEKAGLHKGKVTTIDNIAETYLNMTQYAQAEKYLLSALALRSGEGDPEGLVSSLNRLGKLYLARNELQKAEETALRNLQVIDSIGYLRGKLENAVLLESIYKKKADNNKALYFADQVISLRDTLFRADLSAEVLLMNVRFHTEEQKRELEQAKKIDIIKARQINTQKYFILLLAGIALLLLVISYLSYRSAQFRKKARERVEVLMKELNHRVDNNLQIISDILRLQLALVPLQDASVIIDGAINRIRLMGGIHGLLYRDVYTGHINIRAFMSELIMKLGDSLNDPTRLRTELTLDVADVLLPVDNAIPLGLIINELLTNIYKYAATQNELVLLDIRFTVEKKTCTLYVTDNGPVWDIADARNRKRGLGLFLVETLVAQLKGTWEADNQHQCNNHTITFTRKEN